MAVGGFSADLAAEGTPERTALRSSAPGLLSGLAIVVPTLGAALYFARRTLDSYDAEIMYAVAKSIATTHTTIVPAAADAFQRNTPHSSYGLGQSLLELPAILLALSTGHDPERFAMLVNPALFAAIALVIGIWALTARATAGQAVAVALATSFGTLLLPYTTTGGSELGTAFAIALALLGVELARERHVLGSLVAGVAVCMAVLMRADSAFLIAIPVATAMLVRTWRWFPLFAVTTLPAAVVTLVYNGWHGAQYQGVTLSQGLSHPLATGVYGLLLSPGRGLLLYVPLVVLALAAVPWAWRRSRVVTALCLTLLTVRVLFYAMWFSWQGGWAWGPRFLVPAMPCLAPLLFEIVRRLSWQRRPLMVVAGAAVALSVSVQVLGAAVRYDTDTANLTMTAVWRSDWDSRPQDGVLFDWRYFPIREHLSELRQGRHLTSGYKGPVGP
jgi:hypothetical protein